MIRSLHSLRLLTAAIAVSFTSIGAAFAADGSHSDPVKPAHVCKTGYVYSEKAKSCVKAAAGLLDGKELFQQGRSLAKSGHYNEALAVLAAADQKDSMVLTMIGYAKRKLGNWDEGMAYYHQALAIDQRLAVAEPAICVALSLSGLPFSVHW